MEQLFVYEECCQYMYDKQALLYNVNILLSKSLCQKYFTFEGGYSLYSDDRDDLCLFLVL